MRRSAITAAILFSVIAAIPGRQTGRTTTPTSTPVTPALAVTPTASADVRITAGLAEPVVKTEQPVRFWLTIQNHGITDVENIALDASGLSSFTIRSRCWRPVSGASSCVPNAANGAGGAATSGGAGQDIITTKLVAGQTLSVWGELSSANRQDAQTLYMTVSWHDPAGAASQLVVPLGRLAAQDWLDTTEHVMSSILGLVKDLALPILLAYLAYRFKKWEDEREAQRQKEDRERETNRQEAAKKLDEANQKAQRDLDFTRQQAEKDKETARHEAERKLDEQRNELERERQQLFQTWNQMLRVSHDNATKHYMPILSAARTVHSHVKDCCASLAQAPPQPGNVPGEEKYKHALFYLLLLRKRNKRFTDQRGGYYFKDRVGEDLAAACWSETNRLYILGDAKVREGFSDLLQYVEANDLLITFVNKFDKAEQGSIYATVYAHFCGWLAKPESGQAMDYLETFAEILEFEMNKPYAYWYPPEQKPKLNTPGKVADVLRAIAADQKRNLRNANWKSNVESYLQRSV